MKILRVFFLLALVITLGCMTVRYVPIQDFEIPAQKAEEIANKVAKNPGSVAPGDVVKGLMDSAKTIREQGQTIKDLEKGVVTTQATADKYQADHSAMTKLKVALYSFLALVFLAGIGYFYLKIVKKVI